MNSSSNQLNQPKKPLEEALISVVLPVYNEVAVLDRLVAALRDTLTGQGLGFEILFVNDGSTDGSAEQLDRLAAADTRIKVLHFSRNFGHQSAVHAGLSHAHGDAVVVMDSDLQDEPACLPEFIKHWQMGFDVVYAVRTGRKENFFKRFLFRTFYRTLNAVSCITIPNDAGIFSLMDRRVVQSIRRLAESDRYLPGLRHWVGFRQIGLPVERNPRHDEQPRVSIYQLFQLAKTALFSFSRVPLSSFYVIATISVLLCAACISFTLYHKLFTGLAVPGWASTTMIGSFFGAINALGIGVLGEYVVRIYDQVRNRPLFVIKKAVNFETQLKESQATQILDSVRELANEAKQAAATASPTGSRAFPSVGLSNPATAAWDIAPRV